MADNDQKQVNTDTDQPSTEEAAKPSEPEAVGEDLQSEEAGSSEDSGADQTHSEVQETPSEPENIEPSGASATGEQPTEKPSTPAEEPSVPSEPAAEPAMPSTAPSNENPNAKWYVVHTYSGHENRVATALKQRVESEGLEKKILDVLVPTQDKIEIKSGKKAVVKEKIFPGYILVKMDLDDASWLAVRTTQGVTSFVGIGNKPTPISDAEVATIVKFTQEEAPVYKQVFAPDDTVKIVDGPFSEFIGKVDSVDEERGKIKVLVSIFGRETPVELDFLQVQKL